jgi:hypothetical protein
VETATIRRIFSLQNFMYLCVLNYVFVYAMVLLHRSVFYVFYADANISCSNTFYVFILRLINASYSGLPDVRGIVTN